MPKRFKSKKRGHIQHNNPNQIQLLKDFVPRTQNQKDYVRAIVESDVTFCTGPAGSGKTACAVGLALDYLIRREVEKIVITRPIIEASHSKMGALPGSVREKFDPYLRPLYDELCGYLGKYTTERLIKEEIIEICPLAHMRGLTYNGAILILDEGQNAVFKEIKMFTTRVGLDSKAIITGDIDQTDLPNYIAGGFDRFIDLMNDVEGVATVELDYSDIQRSAVVSRILAKVKGIQ